MIFSTHTNLNIGMVKAFDQESFCNLQSQLYLVWSLYSCSLNRVKRGQPGPNFSWARWIEI